MNFVDTNTYNKNLQKISSDIKNLKTQLDTYKIYTYYVQSYNPQRNTIIVTDFQSFDSPKSGTEVNNPLSFAGVSGKGVHLYPKKGSRVYCVRSDTNDTTICIGVAPEPSKAARTTNELIDSSGETSYPQLEEGNIVIQDDSHSRLELDGDGKIELSNSHGLGIYIYKFAEDDSIYYNINSNINNFSKSGSSRSGFMMRFAQEVPDKVLVPHSSTNTLDVDEDIHELLGLDYITGVFPNSRHISQPLSGEFKNFARTEHRSIHSHMEREFRGWDKYIQDSQSQNQDLYADLNQDEEREMRNIFLGFNSLNMAPNQMVEVVAGNISRNRIPLDINYLPIILGDENRDPKTKRSDKIIEAERVDKRGIGYHFQVNTRSRMDQACKYNDNFVFAVDKEGAFRLNVPKTKEFGNILFPVNCEYYSKGYGVSSYPKSLVPKETEIPIVRQASEDEYLPSINYGSTTRKTGIRYYGLRSFSKKPNGFNNEEINSAQGGERVNPTIYHNMWACAERSISNSVSAINNLSYSKIDEENPIYTTARKKASFVRKKDLGRSGKKDLQSFSEVEVSSGSPAIHHGGDVPFGGKTISKTNGNPYSNSFVVEDEDVKRFEGTDDTSGISANINFEGAVVSSIGKDTRDGKSMLLDCAGSMVSWIGQDSAGRSIVTQTDGGVIMEIGNPDKNDMYSEGEASKGSLYIRVNVTKKGTVNNPINNDNGEKDDYVISISDKGLIIWGANPNTPMVFRNAGDINLESTRGSIYLSSSDKIYYKEGVKKFANIKTKTVVV
jgi:hypothetical protein